MGRRIVLAQAMMDQQGRCARMELRIERTERAIERLRQFAEMLEEHGWDSSIARHRLRDADALLGKLGASQRSLIRAAAGGL